LTYAYILRLEKWYQSLKKYLFDIITACKNKQPDRKRQT